MYNSKMYSLGATGSAIRELFEYGKKRKLEIGEENVFDFSLGNPSIPSPKIVNDTLIELLQTTDPTKLHGYTSASGDDNVKLSIAKYLNNTYNANIDSKLIYMTVGAAASLTISLKALLNTDEEVIIFAPYFPEYKVFIENALGKVKVVKCSKPDFIPDFDLFEKAIKIKPDFYEAHYNLAQILMSINKNEKALESLEEIAKIRPDDSENLYNLGKTYFKKGLLSKSFEMLKKIDINAPEYDSAKLLIEKIEKRQEELNLEEKINARQNHLDFKRKT